MYRMIVARQVRKLWARLAAGDADAAADQAVDDMRFTFVGSTPLSAEFIGREQFRDWFRRVQKILPGIRFELVDVAVTGPPWRTTVATRLRATATLADGSAYRNDVAQWVKIRWGRMTEDWVLEDTLALQQACDIQAAHSPAHTSSG